MLTTPGCCKYHWWIESILYLELKTAHSRDSENHSDKSSASKMPQGVSLRASAEDSLSRDGLVLKRFVDMNFVKQNKLNYIYRRLTFKSIISKAGERKTKWNLDLLDSIVQNQTDNIIQFQECITF